MLTQEELQVLETLFDKKLEPINERLDRIDERLDAIEENLSEVRGATNYMAKWVEGLEKEVKKAI